MLGGKGSAMKRGALPSERRELRGEMGLGGKSRPDLTAGDYLVLRRE